MNLPRFSSRFRPSTPAALLCLAWLACCLPASGANRPGNPVGMRLLQAQVPTDASLRRLDCEHLAKAVGAATLAHRKEAVVILSAALTLDEWDPRRKVEERLSCACVSRLFQAAADAAPAASATLLEIAEAYYPECADTLVAALRGLETDSQVALVSRDALPGDAAGTRGDGSPSSPDGSAAGTGTGDGSVSSANGDPGAVGPFASGASASNTNAAGTGTGEPGPSSSDGPGIFGGGVGPGFPGSPGFSGSGGGGGGGFLLPNPTGVAVTITVNE